MTLIIPVNTGRDKLTGFGRNVEMDRPSGCFQPCGGGDRPCRPPYEHPPGRKTLRGLTTSAAYPNCGISPGMYQEQRKTRLSS